MTTRRLIICLLASAFFTSTAVKAQDAQISPFSLEAQFGFNNPTNPVALGYDARTLWPASVSLGARYMLNSKFGGRAQVGYHYLTNSKDYLDFTTHYFRANIEGVINLGNVLNMHQLTNRFGLLVHGGVGYSVMKEKNWNQDPDNMLSTLIGVTPLVKVGDRMSLSLDIMAICHVYQTRTYDFTQIVSDRGFDGFMYNASVGICYTLGNKTPADWFVPVDLSESLMKLNADMDSLATLQLDDDHDGVPNYLDQDPNSPENALVTTKGVVIDPNEADPDGDGVPNSMDECPFEKGSELSKGCPDADNDGVQDKFDDCPYLAGVESEKGCPELPAGLKNAMIQATMNSNFSKGKSDLNPAAKERLDVLAKILIDNPGINLTIKSHVMSTGRELSDLKLSQDRAYAMRYYLVEKGVSIDRILALGLGMSQPISALTDAKNERIEIEANY